MPASVDIDYSDPVEHARSIGLRPDPKLGEFVEHHVRNLLTGFLYGNAMGRALMRSKMEDLFAVLKGTKR